MRVAKAENFLPRGTQLPALIGVLVSILAFRATANAAPFSADTALKAECPMC